MGSSTNVLAVRLVLALLVLVVGAIVVTHLPSGNGSSKGRVASGGGFQFVLDGSELIVRMTSATPSNVRESVMGGAVQLHCQNQAGNSIDNGPIQRWPEGTPELRLRMIANYSKVVHPVCGVRTPNGAPIASATF